MNEVTQLRLTSIEVVNPFDRCVQAINDPAPWTETDSWKLRQMVARQRARDERKRDLFDGPEAA